MRRAAKVDDNQGEIVAALRAMGCHVAITSAVGNGFPDLVVSRHATETILLEVKDGRKPPSAQKLSDAEAKFHGQFLGPIAVVNSVESAIRAVLAVTR